MFLVWPPRVWFRPPTPFGLRLLRFSTILFVTTSLAIGVRASVVDLRAAFRTSWKTTIPPAVAEQMAVVEKETAGENFLLTYRAPNPWYPRMWQRVFYPRTVILLAREQATPREIARLRDRYGIRFAVSIGPPPPALKYSDARDLGPLLGSKEDRVRFGSLAR